MPRFHLDWKSTPAERYDEGPNAMNARAEREVAALTIFARDGGSDNMTADNSLGVVADTREIAIEAAERIAEAIGKVVIVTENFQQVHETKARFAPDDVAGMLAWATDVVDKQGGRLSFSADSPGAKEDPKVRWMVGMEFGEETPGSMMYAGASYGEGATLAQALANLHRNAGL